MKVEVYSDYTCPWCYIGTVRLDRLAERLAGEIDLEATWRPFEIHPEAPAGGMPVERLGYPPEHWETMVSHLRAQAAEEGLEIGRLERVANTHRALAAGAYAQAEAPDAFPALHRALFRAYFAEGRDIGDTGVVLDVAAGAGVDPDALSDALEEGRYDAAIRSAADDAARLGITGTPTYIFAGRYGAVGAQPVDVLERVARRARGDDAAVA